jgi:hypothetical protein
MICAFSWRHLAENQRGNDRSKIGANGAATLQLQDLKARLNSGIVEMEIARKALIL